MSVWPSRNKVITQEELQQMMHSQQIQRQEADEQAAVDALVKDLEETIAQLDGDPVYSSFVSLLEDILDDIDESGLMDDG